MKNVFIPSMDDLYKMQDMHINILPYLYAKAIERLCIEYNNYPKMGSILRNEYKYLREDPVIAKAICMMYPSEIMYSDIVKYDAGLAMKLISEPNNNDIYRLDNISAKMISIPGMWLQKITTKEPDDSQIEVALVALNVALGNEVKNAIEVFE